MTVTQDDEEASAGTGTRNLGFGYSQCLEGNLNNFFLHFFIYLMILLGGIH